MIYIKSKDEIATMKKAGQIAKGALQKAVDAVRPGITTLELDKIAYDFIVKHNAKPSFYRYNGFPKNICVSVNSEVVHGIPGKRVIMDGDIVSIDCGACYRGFHGDCADTALAGNVAPEAVRLVEITKQSFYAGIKNALPGNRVGDISHAVQSFVEENGYSIVRDLEGHGIGANLHESPSVPNFGMPNKGSKLMAGMTIAVEPMVNMGGFQVFLDVNKSTYKTSDGKYSAHYENTILITNEEPVILTSL
jgi:methionyl aminopeptidase